jgi:predicted lipid-binding transport protein (Tim44 family)
MHIDIATIVFAVIAVALLARLWSILGTRNEDETQRPNPFIPPTPEPDAPFSQTASPLLQVVGPPPASLAGGLVQVKAIDPTFDERAFLQTARETFVSIVETYATGDMSRISDVVAPALLAHFQQAADARKAAEQTAASRVVRIKEAETVAARAEGTRELVTVKIISDQENILRDASGAVLGGAAGKTEEITDVWVFAKDKNVPDAKWVVVETRG